MASDFSGKVAFVTGAGSGIGAAVAQRLAKGGAQVVLADLKEEGVAKVARDIEKADGRAIYKVLDVTDTTTLEACIQSIVREFGALHLAVNNAGIAGQIAPIGEYGLDSWRKVIDINLNSVFYCMRFEIPAMLAAGGGAIVNMSSILGSVGTANSAAYVAAKHGVVGLTQSAALEYSAKGIRVNAVGPGYIETPLLNALDANTKKALVNLHPLGRLGTPNEVATLTTFLLSDEASFISGSYHLVDGGYTAG